MKHNNFFGEYTAPELEVVSTVVEQGFGLSSGYDELSADLDAADERNYGSF